jgi:putative endonuclease
VVFLYILQSRSSGRYYIGITDHLLRRFDEHRRGETAATRGRGPWWMPYYETFETRAEAVRREKQIKNWKSARAIQDMIVSGTPAG